MAVVRLVRLECRGRLAQAATKGQLRVQAVQEARGQSQESQQGLEETQLSYEPDPNFGVPSLSRISEKSSRAT